MSGSRRRTSSIITSRCSCSAPTRSSPAARLPRVGSTPGLIRALVRPSTPGVGQRFRAHCRPGRPTRLDHRRRRRADRELHPQALAKHLTFWQMDLADPEFRRFAGDHARVVRQEIQTQLDAAVAARCPQPGAARLARTVLASPSSGIRLGDHAGVGVELCTRITNVWSTGPGRPGSGSYAATPPLQMASGERSSVQSREARGGRGWRRPDSRGYGSGRVTCPS